MASSKVMTTTSSTTNADPPRQQPHQPPAPPSSSSANSSSASAAGASTICPSFSGLLADLQNPGDLSNQQSMSMDDILKNIYSSTTPAPAAAEPVAFSGASLTRAESKTVKEVWEEIVAGGGGDQVRGGEGGDEEMTLEAFLTKAGAVSEEDVRIYGNNINSNNNVNNCSGNNNFNINNNNNVNSNGNGGAGVGRGKRRVVEAAPVDKATQQKQRRMIKNRESAARSRERKQVIYLFLLFVLSI